ncbi:hypothetical protein HHK36_024216 [Tetracentron sinense]|uniref:B box-type domain-containing protein n=1 Tax=Tetracentron sinense TaxID=13715 RepID=A0A834YJV2_TETSI|nr:hypothetical protein HHK36_024216 [Tetracentron sinense]
MDESGSGGIIIDSGTAVTRLQTEAYNSLRDAFGLPQGFNGGFILPKKKKSNNLDWMDTLLKSKFFGSCLDHLELRKNEMNVYCVDCQCSFCHHCLSSAVHNSDHKLLKIFKYVYRDVVHLKEMQQYLDCSNVQPYKSNGTRVVFLNPRPQPKPSKSNSGPSCEICDRILTGPYGRCSIACKVSVVSQKSGEDQNSPSISFPALVISDSSVTENQNPEQNLKEEESGKEYQFGLNSILKPRKRLNKRKGIPHRAPFF